MAKKMKKATKVLDPALPVFQLEITLEDIEPSIWRRVQTHDCSLDELHEIIQACMGWEDDHMHAFEIEGKQYTSIDGVDSYEFRDARRVWLSRLVEKGCYSFDYEYDFGDSWRHTIVIEETLPAAENRRYPFCVDGARTCPPEDCGGPWGYPDFLAATQDPEHERHDDALEWVGGEFDPEKFDLAEINDELRHLRAWLGNSRGKHMPEPKFAKGDEIRVKPAVVHVEYPDIPLGGWVGAVTRIAWLVPLDYDIRWTPQTLQAAHPVYFKRCQRDDVDPGEHCLEEGQIELNAEHQPPVIEQPTNIVTRPLSMEDQHDRIRMVFGLTSDDPLPLISEQTLQQYVEYLQAHLSFPFDADYLWETQEYMPEEDEAEEEEEEEEQESQEEPEGEKKVTAVGFAAPSPMDPSKEILCEIRRAQETLQVPLSCLMLDEEDPNCRYVDDHKEWLWDTRNRASADEEDFDEAYYEADDEDFEDAEGDEDEDWDEEDEDWDEEDEYSDEEDEDWDEEDEFGEQDEDRAAESDRLLPFRREQPPVGRNDPCPCGSGKKYKKCCLNKQEASVKFPIGTVALYGPDDKRTTKIVAGVVKEEGAEAIIERWVGTGVKDDPKVQEEIKDFFSLHGVTSVVATERNMGCPHEEGKDFPVGGDCPFCPYWKGKQGSGAWR